MVRMVLKLELAIRFAVDVRDFAEVVAFGVKEGDGAFSIDDLGEGLLVPFTVVVAFL